MTSAKTVRRLRRILGMLPYVIANPGVDISEVMERFDYGREQELVDDLNLIFMCGLPGYGPGDLIDADIEDGSVWIDMADYFASPSQFSPREALVLLSAGMAMISSGQSPPALESAVAKLSEALFGSTETPLVVDLDAEPEPVRRLRVAIENLTPVAITYTKISTGETSERVIEPWRVFSTMGNWYVVGHCRSAEGERVFRVDRIRRLDETDGTYELPTQIPEPIVNYSRNEDDVTAVIELGEDSNWVAEYYPVERMGDGRIEFYSNTAAPIARLLLRLGGSARLVAGDQVATELEDARRRLLARYGGKRGV